MKAWLRPSAATIWIVSVQTAWTITLIAWIVYFLSWRAEHGAGWEPLIVGIGLLVVLLALAIVVVLHFSRQVAHNQATKDFVSQVSHDLRSPLATVKLHLETLQLRELDVEQRAECLEMALTELGRLEAGIEDVLTASRVERRKLRLEAGPVELKPFLDQYAAMKSREVELQKAHFEWVADEAPPLVARADRESLRQLLDNIVDNAVHHCPPGVNIRLELAEQLRCAVIIVADDGPGLARSEWKRVFRMFYRAPPSRRHTKGTGLGLYIVAGIAKAHGGKAWVESPGPGKGCIFRVALPLSKESPT